MSNLSYFLDTCPNFIKEKFIYTKFDTFEKILKQNDKPSFVYIIKKGNIWRGFSANITSLVSWSYL